MSYRGAIEEIVLSNYIELIAVLAYNNVSTEQNRGKEFTVFQLMSDNVVLTQVKQVRRAEKVNSHVGQPKDDAVLKVGCICCSDHIP
jgi:hypothetical protein